MTLTDPWTRSSRGDWSASAPGIVLVVLRLGVDRWQPMVEWAGGKKARGPVAANRKAAQSWAEREAGERR